MNKLIIISGPTASGKTGLALKLAKKLNGELISADSRQIYRGMDIVTGKDLPEKVKQNKDKSYDFENIEVWGLDLVNPDENYDVSDFVNFAQDKIKEIQDRSKLPIVVGGTAFWIRSLLNPPETMGVPQNKELREKLEKLDVKELQRELTKVDIEKFSSMNNSDRNNPRRLVRAIEVGKSVAGNRESIIKKIEYDYFWMGLNVDMDKLGERIKKRVAQRLRDGTIDETKNLAGKYSWDLPSMSAIGYQDLKGFVKSEQSLEEAVGLWTLHEIKYARRQMTFLKKEKNINWYQLREVDSYDKIEGEVSNFLER